MILLCKNVQQNFDYVMFTNMEKKKKTFHCGSEKEGKRKRMNE